MDALERYFPHHTVRGPGARVRCAPKSQACFRLCTSVLRRIGRKTPVASEEPEEPGSDADASDVDAYQTKLKEYRKEKRLAKEKDDDLAVLVNWRTVMALCAHWVTQVYDEEIKIRDDDFQTWDMSKPPNPYELPHPWDVKLELEKKGFDRHVVVSFVYIVLQFIGCFDEKKFIIDDPKPQHRFAYHSIGAEVCDWSGIVVPTRQEATLKLADGARARLGELPAVPVLPKKSEDENEDDEDYYVAHDRYRAEHEDEMAGGKDDYETDYKLTSQWFGQPLLKTPKEGQKNLEMLEYDRKKLETSKKRKSMSTPATGKGAKKAKAGGGGGSAS